MIRIQLWVPILMLLAACEHDSPPARSTPAFVVSDVILSVSNRSDQTARVSLEAGGSDYPLGTVAGLSSRSFSLPSGLDTVPNGLRFKAMHQSDRSVRSEPFALKAGEKVEWTFDGKRNRGVKKW